MTRTPTALAVDIKKIFPHSLTIIAAVTVFTTAYGFAYTLGYCSFFGFGWVATQLSKTQLLYHGFVPLVFYCFAVVFFYVFMNRIGVKFLIAVSVLNGFLALGLICLGNPIASLYAAFSLLSFSGVTTVTGILLKRRCHINEWWVGFAAWTLAVLILPSVFYLYGKHTAFWEVNESTVPMVYIANESLLLIGFEGDKAYCVARAGIPADAFWPADSKTSCSLRVLDSMGISIVLASAEQREQRK